MRLFTKLGWLSDTQPFNFLRQAVAPCGCQLAVHSTSAILPLPQVDFGSGHGGGRRAIPGAFGSPNGRRLRRWMRKFVVKPIRR